MIYAVPYRKSECSKCGKIKEHRERSYCNLCHAGATKKWIAQNKEKNTIAVRKYRDSHKEITRQRDRKYGLKRCYGISVKQYDELLKSQNGRCAICGTDTPNGPGKYFMVDHNHITKVIRGLLCCNCNFFLGNAKENKEILIKAIQYLERG